MTIASEITRIRAAKAALMTAINSKGGTLTASQLLGDYAPAVDAIQTGGGETSFYQCASVDIAAGTWTGYKWEWDDTEGKYILSSSLTSDQLTIEGFKPIVGKTYSGNTRESAEMWEGSTLGEGLVFHAPLATDASTTTGQAITGTPAEFTTYKGVPSALISSSSNNMTAPMTADFPTGAEPNTISVWVCCQSLPNNWNMFVGYGTTSTTGDQCSLSINNTNTFYGGVYGLVAPEASFSAEAGTWYHLLCTYDGSTARMYVNGVAQGSVTLAYAVGNTTVWIGYDNFAPYRLAGYRIYNRVLTADEITQLANEFTPTA